MEVLDRLWKGHGIKLRKDISFGEDPSDTTKWYRVSDEYEGRVGFITSMSSNFCGTCNRLRITADGRLKNCLFGSDELNVVDLIRNSNDNTELIEKINLAVSSKYSKFGGKKNMLELEKESDSNRPMILIGG